MSREPAGHLARLRGLSSFAVAKLARLELSPAQVAIHRALWGEPQRNAEELAALRAVTLAPTATAQCGPYRELWARAGRRGGKTTHLAAPAVVALQLAQVEPLLAPGERARVICVAPTRHLTGQLLDAVEGLWERLSVPVVRRDGDRAEIEVPGLRTVVVVATADHVSTRGGTAVGVVLDEAALLPTEEDADGRDVEVLAALRPTMATLGSLAKLVAISSPWDRRSVFHTTVEGALGRLNGPILAIHAPTHALNPRVSLARSHELEPDPVRHAREYLAETSDAESSFVRFADVAACVDRGVRERSPSPDMAYAIGFDLGTRRDHSAAVVAHRELRERADGPPVDVCVIDAVRLWRSPVAIDVVIAELAALVRRYRATRVVRDLFSGDAVEALLRQRGIESRELPVDSGSQARRWDLLATCVRAGTVRLIEHEELIGQLRDLRMRLHSRGRIEVAAPTRKSAHDDVADALALALDVARSLPPSGDVFRDVRVHWSAETREITAKETWFRRASDGGAVPIAPPRGTAAYEQLQRERWALGAYTAEELDELEKGPAAARRVLSIPVRNE